MSTPYIRRVRYERRCRAWRAAEPFVIVASGTLLLIATLALLVKAMPC